MAMVFVIPGPLREFAAGRDEVRIQGNAASVGDALTLLWTQCPGARDRVLTERGEVRPHVNIFVDGDMIVDRQRLSDRLGDETRVFIAQALSGG